MTRELDDILERLTALLDADERVHTAWLFGSTARGETRSDSDLDLALRTHEALPLEERLRLGASLQKRIADRDIDVVFLNDAGPVLRYEVVRDGRRILSRDEREADAFEHRTAMEYLDTAYYRDLQRRLARDSLE